jgi:hypothetical protein
MATGRIIEAVKRRVKRGLQVLGLYVLWQSTGWTLAILFIAVLGGSALKSSMAMPLPNVGAFDPLLTPLRLLHWHTTRFLIEHPNAWSVWQHLPHYEPANPFTLLTPAWGVVVSMGLMGRYLLHKKVKEASAPSSSFTVHNTVHGDVGVVNQGTVKHIESIAGRLTQISLPSQRETAQAIVKVAEAVREEPTLGTAMRREQLDRLLQLAQQTELPAAKRSPSFGRATVRALDAALSRAGNLADIWSAWGPTIKAFFEVSD